MSEQPIEQSDEAVYLIFNGDVMSDVEKIPVKDIALIDIRQKARNLLIVNAMLLATIVSGLLVAAELIMDVTWISDGMLEVIGAICVGMVTSSAWYVFGKRYEVMVTLSSGKKQLLE